MKRQGSDVFQTYFTEEAAYNAGHRTADCPWKIKCNFVELIDYFVVSFSTPTCAEVNRLLLSKVM